MGSRLAQIIAVWMLFGQAIAHAQAPAFELDWQAPADCDRHDAVLEQARSYYGGALPARRVAARVTHQAQWHLELQLSADASRSIDASSCDELANATAVILAMWLHQDARPLPQATDDERPGVARVAPPAPAVPEELRDGVAPATEPRSEISSTPARPLDWAVRTEGELAVASVPRLSGGIRFAAGVEHKWWNVELGARWLASARRSINEGSVAFQTATLFATAGGAFELDAWRFELVGGMHVGAVMVGSKDLGSGNSRVLIASGILGARARYRFASPHLGMYVATDVELPLTPATFDVIGFGAAGTIEKIGFSGRFGFEAIF